MKTKTYIVNKLLKHIDITYNSFADVKKIKFVLQTGEEITIDQYKDVDENLLYILTNEEGKKSDHYQSLRKEFK